ncbi:MAG: hypothetical protein H3C50_06655 [Kiritimatiellae bacterium]|nr:hypothetical protein [Kiritimatiellia bacterium]MCO5067704.1 hypothetical protein [Kiritimatiellia bacterium]
MDTILPIITAVASLVSAIILILVLGKLGNLANQQPTQAPGVTAEDLGPELANAISEAFHTHVPNPEKFAATLQASIEQATKKSGDGVEALHKNMLAAQTKAVESWATSEKTAAQGFETVARALESATAKLNDALAAHTQQTEKLANANRDQLKTILDQHAASLNQSSTAIAGQLDKIMQLEKEIQNLLHIQQAVDGSIKAVSSAEEFKATLVALRTHLDQSDALLREAAKPRTIRLVEQDS